MLRISFQYGSSNEFVSPSLWTTLLNDVHRLPSQQLCENLLPLRSIAHRLRIYRDLKLKNLFKNNSLSLLINLFEQHFYPWMRTTDSLLNEFKADTKGIVMPLNDKYLHIGISSIMALKAIGNQLSIEIICYDNHDLSLENRKILLKLPLVVRIIDLTSVFNNLQIYTPMGQKISHAIVKPFAILASSFQHVLLMDSDVYFFQKPSHLFNYTGYLNTGFLLFSDRTVDFNYKTTAWIKSIMPEPYSDKFQRSRFVQNMSGHETESSVVVVNKGVRTAYLALLTTCMLNTRCYRYEMLNNYLHNGDKETYWLALEMMQLPYHKDTIIGALGDVNKQGDTVCGHVLHGDESHNLFWWNGGFRLMKHHTSPLMKFTSYVWEPEDNSVVWKWPCLTRPHEYVKKLSEQQLQLIRTYQEYNGSFLLVNK